MSTNSSYEINYLLKTNSFFDLFSPWIDRSSGGSYAISSPFSYITSSPSSATTSSHYTIQSSKHGDERNKHGSSTTIYASSHQSDSLFNEPTIRKSARIMTTSYNNNQKESSRKNFYRDLSTPSKKLPDKTQNLSDINREKITSSTSNLSYGKIFFYLI